MKGSPVASIHENDAKSLPVSEFTVPGGRIGRGPFPNPFRFFTTWLAAGVLVLGSGCTTLSSKRQAAAGEPEYSLIHLSGNITSIPDPGHWPGILRVGKPVDLWITVDNRSNDTSPSDPKRGRYLLDEIPEAWRIRIRGVAEFGHPRDTTSPSLSVLLTPPGLQGYHFESGYITAPADLPQHKSLLVSASLRSSLPLSANDRLPLTEVPVESFDKVRTIQIRATHRKTGIVETITVAVDRFKVHQTRP